MLTTPLKTTQLKQPAKNCSQRYYEDLQQVQATRIAPLRKQLKPLFQKDKKLPGKWIFATYKSRHKARCLKYRTYRSGAKKCRKWQKRAQPQITNPLLENEKQHLEIAQSMVRNKGRHPDLNPKSANYWVINKVASDLNGYSKQPFYPTICTGAIRMVDYFDKNLGRAKKHIAMINAATAQGAHLIEQRRRLLNERLASTNVHMLQTTNAPITNIQSNSDAIINEKILSLAPQTSNHVIEPLNPNDLKQSLVNLSQVLLGEQTAKAMAQRDGFIQALGYAKKQYNNHGTIQDMDRETVISMKRLMTLLEAQFYIQRAHQQLQILSTNLIGTLSDLRQTHKKTMSMPIV